MLSLHKVINSNDGNSLSNKQRRHAKSVDTNSDFGFYLPAGRQSVVMHGIIRVACLNSCAERKPPIQ